MAARSEPDHETIRRAQAGEREAWESLFLRVEPRLRARVARRLGPSARRDVEIDDVLQTTLLRAYESRGRFEWRGETAFVAWLATLAHYVVLESVREAARRPSAVEDESLLGETSDADGVRREERFDRLLRAFERLSADHRKALRLVRLEGLPIRVVADRMGRSESAVRHLLLRALQKLREEFGEPTASFRLPSRRLVLGTPSCQASADDTRSDGDEPGDTAETPPDMSRQDRRGERS